jgi:uncharacterized NAD-dependent epimerase/dehydratase family protein
MKLNSLPQLTSVAARRGRKLFDVRTPPPNLPIGSGRKRTGKRLLTVGTDCAVGKKYSALTLTRAFTERGLNADFRATGQTGIMISGSGIPLDAVVADFAAGAAEYLSPDAPPDHWDVIEGQGSLFHPAYAGVSMSLLHGSQPDVIVVCHAVDRLRLMGAESFALPSIEETIELNLRHGKRTNPAVRCGGVCLNTASLPEDAARALLAKEGARLGLPVADPVRRGPEFNRLVDNCLS